MGMIMRVPMAARRRLAKCLLLALAACCLCGFGFAQSTNSPATDSQSSGSEPKTGVSSSSKTGHRKTGINSSETVRHTRVREESAGSAELAQAEDLIQKKNYPAAEPLLRQAVEMDSGNYVAWFDLGFVENGLGKSQESIAAYRKSVAAKPDVFESNLNLGIELAKSGQLEAEQFLRAATQLKPSGPVAESHARAWISLGQVLEKLKPEEAIAAYREAATLRPKDAEPHLQAGLLLEKQQKFAEAEAEYKQALAIEPSPDAITGLANIYMRGRRLPEAEEYLKQLVQARPQQAEGHVQLGRVLAAENKNDAALTELQTGAKLAPNDLAIQRDLAELYSTTGKNDQAESAYRALLTAQPENAELHDGLGKSLMRQKKFPAAQAEFLAAVKLKPDFGEAYGDLGFVAGENNDFPLALKAHDSRAKFLPEMPMTYFLRASAWDHLKDFKKAAANYHLFLDASGKKDPDLEWKARHRLIAIERKK
jgi:tetratricopeptide (TPR) repeat protein